MQRSPIPRTGRRTAPRRRAGDALGAALRALVPCLLLAGPAGATATSGAMPASSVRAEPALGAFLAGTVASQLGDNAAAADLLQDALAHDPAEQALLQPTFLVLTLAGRPQAPVLAARLEPTLITRLVLANDAAMRGDWAKAAADFTALPASPLDDAIRPLLLAWSLQGAGQTDRALQILAAVGGGGLFAGSCALHAAEIADLAGRTDAASNLYRTAQAFSPDASLPLTRAFASFLVRHGDPGDARTMIHTLAQQIPVLGMVEPRLLASLSHPEIATPRQGLAQAYLAIAALMQEQGAGGREAASFMLRFSLDLDPGLVGAQLMLADLLAPQHPDAALQVLSPASPASDALQPLATLRAATLLAATGHRAESRTRLEALMREFPQRPEPAQALGDVLSDAKLYAEAVPAYDRAIADRERLTGHRLAGNDWQLLFSRGVAFDRQDKWPQAQADLQHALALSPDQPFVLNYLGYSLVERHQDLAQARVLIQRALDGKPDDGSIRDSLGWVMLRQDDVPAAIRTLERAAEEIPEDPTVNYHLGAAYWAAGRPVEAEDQWRWALLLHPEPDDAAKIRASLRRAGVAVAQPTPAGHKPR